MLESVFDIPTLVAAICTIGILSMLYKESWVSRLFENMMVGLSMGYGGARLWTNYLEPNWWDKMVGADGAPSNYWWLLVLPPASLWFFQLSKKRKWLNRLIICFFMGFYASLGIKGIMNLLLTPGKGQIPDTFRSVYTPHHGGTDLTNWLGNVTNGFLHITADDMNAILFMVISLCVLSYFYFTFRHESNPLLRGTSKMGRVFLMICFGAIFGGAVQGRMALLIDRLGFLFNEWLGLPVG